MIVPTFKILLEKGKLLMEGHGADTFHEYVKAQKDGWYSVSIKKWVEKKWMSNQERKYYWAVPIKMLSDLTGDSPDDWHKYLRREILAKNVIPEKCRTMLGEIVYIPSINELTTVEMESYLSQIREYASINHGCFVPLPNEAEY